MSWGSIFVEKIDTHAFSFKNGKEKNGLKQSFLVTLRRKKCLV